MPQAFGSFGAHIGTGSMLTRDAVTALVFAEAEEVWVVAAAPVRARTTTKARTICFMTWDSLVLQFVDSFQVMLRSNPNLSRTHPTGIRIVWCTHRNGQHANAGCGDLGLGGGVGGLGCGSCTGENEDDDESANDMFHNEIPPKLYLCKKISLDKPDDVTIGYKLE
jgi:hypothetical protein